MVYGKAFLSLTILLTIIADARFCMAQSSCGSSEMCRPVSEPIAVCPCTEPLTCVANVCVNEGTVDASLVSSYVMAPNNIYSIFFLWDNACNPYSVPPSLLNRFMILLCVLVLFSL